jgi:hypothetical protein
MNLSKNLGPSALLTAPSESYGRVELALVMLLFALTAAFAAALAAAFVVSITFAATTS